MTGTVGAGATVMVVDESRRQMIAGDGQRSQEWKRETHRWDPSTLLHGAGLAFSDTGEGVLVVRQSTHTPQEWAAQALSNGWAASSELTSSPWRSYRRRGCGNVHVLLHHLARPEHIPFCAPEWNPYAIYSALARWHELTGVAFRATPGVSAIASLRRHWWGRAAPTWRWPERPPELLPTTPPQWRWERSGRKPAGGYVHRFDVNRQYLAAMNAAMLGWPPPEPEGAAAFDPARSGLWRIQIADPRSHTQGARLRPNIFTAFDREGRGMATTPTVAYLAETNVKFEILDAYLSPLYRRNTHASGKSFPATTRLFRPWAERWAVAQGHAATGHQRTCTCAACRMQTCLKRGPNEMVGLLGSTAGGVAARLDLAWTIRDVARVALLRKIDTAADTGLLPLWVLHDSVWYWTEDPSPAPVVNALGPGTVVGDGQHGRLRYEGTVTMEEDAAIRKAEGR